MVGYANEYIERIGNEVSELYFKIFGKYPNEDYKMNYVRSVVNNRMKMSDIEKSLLDSDEYVNLKRRVRIGEIDSSIAYVDEETCRIVWYSKDEFSTIEQQMQRRLMGNHITFLSTFGIRCGIATYTEYLMNAINKHIRGLCNVYPLNSEEPIKKLDVKDILTKDMLTEKGILDGVMEKESKDESEDEERKEPKILHIQHEFGIMPKEINTGRSKVLVTFHSATKDTFDTMMRLENDSYIIGYITHFEESRKYLQNRTKKNVWTIPHGSKIIYGANIEEMKYTARGLLNFKNLGIGKKKDVAFMFGFQSGNKNINRLIRSCANAGIKMIISGGVHRCGYENVIDEDCQKEINNGNVVFLGKFLNDVEIDLFALSSDILLFDYIPQDHYSCSGAMHRVVGAGRPIIASRTNHFIDIREDNGALKFSNEEELEFCIREGLNRRGELGKMALEYAEKTSWDNVAKMHLDIYRHHMLIKDRRKDWQLYI